MAKLKNEVQTAATCKHIEHGTRCGLDLRRCIILQGQRKCTAYRIKKEDANGQRMPGVRKL